MINSANLFLIIFVLQICHDRLLKIVSNFWGSKQSNIRVTKFRSIFSQKKFIMYIFNPVLLENPPYDSILRYN